MHTHKGFIITCNNCGGHNVWITDDGIQCCDCKNTDYCDGQCDHPDSISLKYAQV